MGYNSVVMILNDALGQIEPNPLTFTEKICKAIRSAGSYLKAPIDLSIGNHGNAATLYHMSHADDHIPYLVGGNCMRRLNCDPLWYTAYRDSAEVDLELLKSMADKMGYRLTKKRAQKVA